MARANHHHRGAGQIGRSLDGTAVMKIAVAHRALVWIELAAHGRSNAVCADQDVGLNLVDRLARRIGEARNHLVAALLKAFEAMLSNDSIETEPLADRLQQHLVQCAAADRNLRPAVASLAAAHLAPNELAELVVERHLLTQDTDRGEPFAEAERG